MSDETPRDDELTSASMDMEELRRADELETVLAAALAGAHPGINSTESGHATNIAISDEHFARMLVEVSAGIVPDADFAADLRARIEGRIRERGAGSAGDNGHNGHGRAARLGSTWRRYRPLWAAIAALALLSLLLALPPVRASLRGPLCLGSVCIVWGGAPSPAAGVQGSPTPTSLPSALDLAGRTTLAQALAQAPFPVRLPTYPPDLGQPDDVFLQNLDGTAVVLVWRDPAHPDQARLSLFELSSGAFVYKFPIQPIAVTSVHGQKALWTTGPYMVELRDGTYDRRLLVTGHVLVWTEDNITYRLETSLPLDEAVKIAESLR
jgi:hypothetical protein